MSTIDNSALVQAEIISRVKTIAGTNITGIYDLPPSNAMSPYVTIGEVSAFPNPSKDIRFFRYTVTLHVWMKDTGTISTRNILSKINAELDNTNLVLTGGSSPAVYFLSSTIVRDPDNITIHGVIRFEVIE